MPKLAREYNTYNYSYQAASYSNVYNYTKYVQEHNVKCYSELREHNRPKKKNTKKKSLGQILVSLSVMLFLICYIMPYSFNNVTKAIFVPTPHKNIKTNMTDLAFPTHNYLSNTWYLGQRGFNYSASAKKAKMQPINENVSMPALRQELMNLAELYPQVKPAVYVWDYDTGNYVDINGSKDYATASIIKIPVLIDVFKTIEAGELSLNDEIALSEYYRTEGSGSLQFKAANSHYTVDELARRMITESDNSATNMLMAKIGSMTDVNQAIRDWGLKNTYVQTWLPDLAGTNRTTAKEMATILFNIDTNDKLLSDESRTRIFNYMGHVHNDRLIQAGLGQGSVFLHKTGDIGTMLGDAGIVIAPDGKKYIIVILANRPHNSAAGKDFIVKASEIIYNYMVK